MRFRLNDPLVNSFIYKNQKYEIDLAFDNVLDVFDVLNDKALRNYEKSEICLALTINEEVNGTEAIKLWNYIYENFIKFERKQPIEFDQLGNPVPIPEEEYMDLEQDAEYIYSSFKQAYNLNLFEQQGKLHWHEFKALLHGLPSDTIMQKIVQIRAWKPKIGRASCRQ